PHQWPPQPQAQGQGGQGQGAQGQGAQGQGAQGQAQDQGQWRGQQGQWQGQGRFAPEQEGEVNSMTFLLGRGYQIVAGWEGTLVLQRADRVYLCPYIRYRSGNNSSFGQAITQPCQHLREGMHT